MEGESPLRGGAEFVETRELLGRRARSRLEVAVFEPGRELSLRVVEGPVRLTVRHLLEPAGEGGTRLTVDVESEPGGVLRLAAPIAARAAARQARADLERLSTLLDAGA